jgi:ABC-2 type transport system ATP-binding protein
VFLPEDSAAATRLEVKEAVALAATLHGVSSRELPLRVARALTQVGMEGLARRRVAALSKGQRRRGALAQVLAVGARLLVLDEPLDGVDPVWRERCRSCLRELARDGANVILSSHSLEEVEDLADTVTLLRAGRVVISGGLDEVLEIGDEWQIRVAPGASPIDAEALRARLETLGPRSLEIRRPRRDLLDLLRDQGMGMP